MSTTPAAGRIVHVLADPNQNNGADVAPAIITRVWSEDMVNVRVLGDNAGPPEWKTSIKVYETREEAAASNTAAGAVPYAAFWPPRV